MLLVHLLLLYGMFVVSFCVGLLVWMDLICLMV